MSGSSRPRVSRVYQNHSLDSTRWSQFQPRADDVVIASSYKSGTTWVQLIALSLLHPGEPARAIMERSPWFESPLEDIDNVLARLDAQSGRRVVKTHLPLDGLPYHDDVNYIVVGRDPRDVFMSLWNHYRNLIRWPILRLPMHPRRAGGPLPRCPDDVRDFWQDWITRGWFPWERDGYPFWSTLRHTQTWWAWRHLPNVLFIHFNELLEDRTREIRRMSSYLNVALTGEGLRRLAEETGFENMRRNADALIPSAGGMFAGGSQTFLFRGTNNRWRDVLTDRDLLLYDEAAGRELSPDCRAWIEHASR